MKQSCRRISGCDSGQLRRSGSGKTFMRRWEKISHLTMKVMMFCVFWHKTTSTEVWWNREKRKIVELTPLIATNSFKNLNTTEKTQKARPKTCSIARKQHLTHSFGRMNYFDYQISSFAEINHQNFWKSSTICI